MNATFRRLMTFSAVLLVAACADPRPLKPGWTTRLSATEVQFAAFVFPGRSLGDYQALSVQQAIEATVERGLLERGLTVHRDLQELKHQVSWELGSAAASDRLRAISAKTPRAFYLIVCAYVGRLDSFKLRGGDVVRYSKPIMFLENYFDPPAGKQRAPLCPQELAIGWVYDSSFSSIGELSVPQRHWFADAPDTCGPFECINADWRVTKSGFRELKPEDWGKQVGAAILAAIPRQ